MKSKVKNVKQRLRPKLIPKRALNKDSKVPSNQSVKPNSQKQLQQLSLSIGNFIRYWGFRRIHGAIWTQLYLSKIPLSCTDLTSRLELSKALISPALDELCKYKLIHESPAPNNKTKIYQASDNISDVIQHVLKTREEELLKQITKDFYLFSESEANFNSYDVDKIKSLGEMILAGNLMLQVMLSQKDILKMPSELDV